MSLDYSDDLTRDQTFRSMNFFHVGFFLLQAIGFLQTYEGVNIAYFGINI